MKLLDHLNPTVLTISFAIFFFSISLATSNQEDVAKFLQCLPTHSNSSKPILQSTYTPDNSSYTSVLHQYARNRRYMTSNTPKPVAIVVAMHESHIQAAILCAKANNIQLRVRSGGHDYEGLSYVSYVPFVILDMFQLRAIDVDIASETAWVQAGAILGEIYYRIAEKSKIHAFPGGICLTVGAGGYISGGGYSTLMRKYGLSVDNIVDAQIVDVNGRILDRETMGEDLFWAIRGGGGASFGVILSWKIRLVRIPETVTVFKVRRTLAEGATDIFYKFQLIATKFPEELFIRTTSQVVNGSHEGEKTIQISFYGMYQGNPNELLAIMNKRFPELRFQENDAIPMSWVNSTMYWYDIPIGTPIEAMLDRPKVAMFFKNRPDYLTKPLKKSVLESIWKKMIEKENIWMQLLPYGGKISEISETATPFPHRRNMFLIQYSSSWEDEKHTELYLNESKEFHEFMTPFVTRSPRDAFLNYRDLDVGSNPSNATYIRNAKVYGVKYFKGNFDRLVRVKSRVDPDNFFKNEQSIPPKPFY